MTGRRRKGQVRRPAIIKSNIGSPGSDFLSDELIMLAAILISASVFFSPAARDTLDVATVSARPQAETAASSPVQRLTGDELRRSGAAYLSEAVRSLSGVSIKDYGGIGGLKTVSIRNLGAAHTIITYDGIALSDAQNGQVDISRFFLDDLDEIKVAIAQEDDIFISARSRSGSGALHLKSRAPLFDEHKSANLTAGVTIGSFGTYTPKLRYEQKIGNQWAMTASASWLTSEGDYPFLLKNGNIETLEKRLGSDVSIINSELNLFGNLGAKGGDLSAKINFHNSERGLPGSVVLYTQNPTERLWDRNILLSSRYENSFGPDWKIEAALSYTNAWNRYIDTSALYPEPQDNRYTQQEAALTAMALYTPLPYLKISLAEDLFGNFLDSNIPECPFPRRLSTLTALSAQYVGDRLRATVSLLGTYVSERTLTGTAAPDRGRLSPSAGVSYGFLKNRLHLRASYKDGFRVPTFNDLYYARVGNTSLRPEKAQQFNVGITWSSSHGDNLDIDITADGYMNLVRDKIVATPTMFIWKMRNVGKVNMYGADLSANLRWRAAEWLTMYLRGNYSYQYAVDLTDPESKNHGHQIPYTPRHSGNSILSVETRWITATYTLNAVGNRWALPQNIPANLIEGYCDHSLSLNHSMAIRKIRLHLSLEALNLSGANYEVIRYYPMPGRNYRLTLKISY